MEREHPARPQAASFTSQRIISTKYVLREPPRGWKSRSARTVMPRRRRRQAARPCLVTHPTFLHVVAWTGPQSASSLSSLS